MTHTIESNSFEAEMIILGNNLCAQISTAIVLARETVNNIVD